MTASNIRQSNILVDVQGRQVNAEPGSVYERVVTVQNRDSKPADLFLWVSAPKGKDQELLRWYNLEVDAVIGRDKDEISIKLQPGESKRINLSFKIPFIAEPGIYNYEVCVQSSVGSEPVCRRQQLTIPYSEHYWKHRTEPEFNITPPSSSENPQVVKAGESVTFEIKVKNRSNSVDNFTVVLPELSEDDFNCCPDYPDGNAVDGLRLNPGDEGIIKLLIQPKRKLPPGQYFSTLRLKSQKSNSAVLGIIYLNIPVDDSLTINFSPPSRKIPSPTTSFELKIHNTGNIRRQITFSAKDDENYFKYLFEPAHLTLEPNLNEATVILTPKPNYTSFSKRSWKGEEIQVPFQVYITEPDTGSIPNPPSGVIIWKPHPAWYNWFLNQLNKILFLLIFLALASAGIILVRELMWKYVVQPSLKPQVTEFVTTEKSYQVGQQNGVRVTWEIQNLGQLEKVQVYRTLNEIEELTFQHLFITEDENSKIQINNQSNLFIRPLIKGKNNLNKTDDKPIIADKSCEPNQQNMINLYCHIIKSVDDNLIKPVDDNLIKPMSKLTAADELDQKVKYTVRIPQEWRQTTSVKENGFCKIKSIPPDKSPIPYLWKVFYGNKKEMEDYKKYETQVIRCSNVLVAPFGQDIQKKQQQGEGNYQFEIKLFIKENPKENPTVVSASILSASKIIKDIKVIPAPTPVPEPLPQPEIQTFAPVLPVYRQSEASITNKANKNTSSQQLPESPVKVNWAIANPKNISRLEMNIAFVGLDGKTQSTAIKTYPFLRINKSTKTSELFTWQLPDKLPCRIIDQDRFLVCQNVPVTINPNLAGQYKLTLTAFPIPGERAKDLKSVIKTIEAITIKPSLPQIQSFKVNGLDVLTNPNQIFTFEQGKNPSDVDISWQVKNPQQMTVELLPAPGLLPVTMNKMLYKLSPKESNTPITLKVTNQIGESVTQTVMLQTVANVQPQIKPGTVPLLPPPPPPIDGAKPSNNVPLNPEDLPPFELPPKTN